MAKLVTIFGGSGFVGRQVARLMAKRGWRVRIAVRRPDEALFTRTYGAVGQVVPILCNVRDEMSVRAAMSDADAVVNCVNLLGREGKSTFDNVIAGGAATIARLSAEMGVARIVHISGLGVDPNSPSRYIAASTSMAIPTASFQGLSFSCTRARAGRDFASSAAMEIGKRELTQRIRQSILPK